MPTGAIVTPLIRTPLAALAGDAMSPEAARFNDHVISTFSFCALGVDMAGFLSANIVSSTWGTANKAVAFPFEIAAPFLVRKVFWFNGITATTDSADVGVYTEAGARLVSGGGTAISGASQTQEVDVTDTFLKPGRYLCAYVQNGGTATPTATATSVNLRCMGAVEMSTAYPLPTTFTPAAITNIPMPLFGIASRTLVS